jgi:hypothetical protein
MTKFSRQLPFLLLACSIALSVGGTVGSSPAYAQIVGYNFFSDIDSPGVDPDYNVATTLAPNVSATPVEAGVGVGSSTTIEQGFDDGDDSLRVFQLSPTATTAEAAVAENIFFQFTVTPNIGFEMDLSSLTFGVARSGGSTPRGWVLRSSVDGFATNLATATIPTVIPTFTPESVDLSGAQFQNLTAATTFRFYVYSPSPASNLNFDDIVLNGSVTNQKIPEPGTVALVLLGVAGVALRWRGMSKA